MDSSHPGLKVLKTFKSKKNSVHLVEYRGEERIGKRYDGERKDLLHVEERVLRECRVRGIQVPEIIGITGGTLILEYIHGINCKELFGSPGEKASKMLTAVARWLSHFHMSFELERRRGDCILANFILTPTGVYGIDFEESRRDNHLRDVADMCTSILRMEPSFTRERFDHVDHFIGEYFDSMGKDRTDLTAHVVESILHYSEYGTQGDRLKGWAARIKEVGLDSILRS